MKKLFILLIASSLFFSCSDDLSDSIDGEIGSQPPVTSQKYVYEKIIYEYPSEVTSSEEVIHDRQIEEYDTGEYLGELLNLQEYQGGGGLIGDPVTRLNPSLISSDENYFHLFFDPSFGQNTDRSYIYFYIWYYRDGQEQAEKVDIYRLFNLYNSGFVTRKGEMFRIEKEYDGMEIRIKYPRMVPGNSGDWQESKEFEFYLVTRKNTTANENTSKRGWSVKLEPPFFKGDKDIVESGSHEDKIRETHKYEKLEYIGIKD